jgi:hypothetical protein
MRCSKARDLLFRRLDAELSVAETLELDGHLAACTTCERQSKLLMIPHRIGRMIPVLAPSPFFYSRLKTRLETEAQGINIWQIILGISRHLVPALAAITLIMLSVFAYSEFAVPTDDVSQAYDRIFIADDHPQQLAIAGQVEITDETVLNAITEDESVSYPATRNDSYPK